MKNIAFFFGGCSPEYGVSLKSAYSVITHVNKTLYRPILIGIEHNTGKWYYFTGNEELIPTDDWFSGKNCTPVFPSTDRSAPGVFFLENMELKFLSLDAAFPVMHGQYGEDGTLQGLLELCGIPLIGCGALSSAVCMDKELSHRIVREGGIKTAASVIFSAPFSLPVLAEAAERLNYPLFVKPLRAGSSFGITKVSGEKELAAAVKQALLYDTNIIMEEMIPGHEVGCAVYERAGQDPVIGEVDEIELSDGFFDYSEKYTLKTSKIHVPAKISLKKTEEIKKPPSTSTACSNAAALPEWTFS